MTQLNIYKNGVNDNLTGEFNYNFGFISNCITAMQSISSTLAPDISTELAAHSQTASTLVAQSDASVSDIPISNATTSTLFNNNFNNLGTSLQQEDKRMDTLTSNINNATVRNAHGLVPINTNIALDDTTITTNTYSSGLDTSLASELNSDFSTLFNGANIDARGLGQAIYYTDIARTGHSSSVTTSANLVKTSGSLTEDTTLQDIQVWSDILPDDFVSLIGLQVNNGTTSKDRTILYSTGSSYVIGNINLDTLEFTRYVGIATSALPDAQDMETGIYDTISDIQSWKAVRIDSNNFVLFRLAIAEDGVYHSHIGMLRLQAARYNSLGILQNSTTETIKDFSGDSVNEDLRIQGNTVGSYEMFTASDTTYAYFYFSLYTEENDGGTGYISPDYTYKDKWISGSFRYSKNDITSINKRDNDGGTRVNGSPDSSGYSSVINETMYSLFGTISDVHVLGTEAPMDITYYKNYKNVGSTIWHENMDDYKVNAFYYVHLGIFTAMIDSIASSGDDSVSGERLTRVYVGDSAIVDYDSTSDEFDRLTPLRTYNYTPEGVEFSLIHRWDNGSSTRTDKDRVKYDGTHETLTNFSQLSCGSIKYWFIEDSKIKTFHYDNTHLYRYWKGTYRYKKPIALPTNSQVFVYGLPTLHTTFDETLPNIHGVLEVNGTEYTDEWITTPSTITSSNYIVELDYAPLSTPTTSLYLLQNTDGL